MDIAVDDKFRLSYGENNVNNIPKIHIAAIFDEDMIVYKYWLRVRQRWVYKVENIYWFEIRDESGGLIKLDR